MILENENIRLVVDRQAAEMHELHYKPSGKQWIWTADPAFWPQRNPILFPIVGSTFDKKIRLEDRVTEMGNHGFARHALFELLHQDDHSITLALRSNPDTMRVYPFEFELKVVYHLHDEHLAIEYHIENQSNQPMPFSFGLHPAFLTTHNGVDGPLRIHFPCVESSLPASIVDADAPKDILLTDAFFETTPTLILEGIASPSVSLIDRQDVMEVSTTGYRWLAFWKKPKAKFICIEPWHGHDDFEEVACAFKDREGTLILAPHHSYTTVVTLKPSVV